MEYFLFTLLLIYNTYLNWKITDLKNTVSLFDRLQQDVNADRHQRLQKLEVEVGNLIWDNVENKNQQYNDNIIAFRSKQ